jgi:hypothetical protein
MALMGWAVAVAVQVEMLLRRLLVETVLSSLDGLHNNVC